jgi:hypothetical protein
MAVELLVLRRWRGLPWDWRLSYLLPLWAYFLFTTYQAKVQWGLPRRLVLILLGTQRTAPSSSNAIPTELCALALLSR